MLYEVITEIERGQVLAKPGSITPHTKFEAEVLIIHTDKAGEITKRDLDKAREAARDIDKAVV